MAGGAPVAPSADEPPTPTGPSLPYAMPMGMGMTDPNQMTTKPRQMPGDGGSGEGGPPGEEGPPDEESSPTDPPIEQGNQSPPPPSGGGVQAKRLHAASILAMMRTARRENPDLGQRDAYNLAKAALVAYPIVVTAEGQSWDGLDFGNREPVADGPIAKAMQELPSLPFDKPKEEQVQGENPRAQLDKGQVSKAMPLVRKFLKRPARPAAPAPGPEHTAGHIFGTRSQ